MHEDDVLQDGLQSSRLRSCAGCGFNNTNVAPNLGDTHERGHFEVDVSTLLAERLTLQGGSA